MREAFAAAGGQKNGEGDADVTKLRDLLREYGVTPTDFDGFVSSPLFFWETFKHTFSLLIIVIMIILLRIQLSRAHLYS